MRQEASPTGCSWDVLAVAGRQNGAPELPASHLHHHVPGLRVLRVQPQERLLRPARADGRGSTQGPGRDDREQPEPGVRGEQVPGRGAVGPAECPAALFGGAGTERPGHPAVCGLATLLFGACPNSAALFSALWFLNGLAQGCGWPSCAKVLRKWYAPSQFGTWWSVLSASANISGGVAPFLSAFLIVSYGWRFSLTVAGTVSVAMGAVAALAVVNEPSDVGLRVEGVAEDQPAAAGDGKSAATAADLVRSPFLWLVSFGYLVVFCAKTSAIDWGQLYLMEDLGHSQYVGSSLTSSIESGGFFGGILAGYLTDWFLHARKGRGSGNARMPVAVLFLAGVAAGFHALCFHISRDSSELAISCLGLFLGACLYGPIAIFGVAATESAPAHLSGTSHAVAALAASVGAVISGLPFSLLAQNRSWGDVFLLLEVACAATAAILFLGRNLAAGIGRPKTH